MRAIRLIAVSDDYDTAPGLMIKGTPSFDGFMADRTGETIPHDLLEHQNGLANMGPVWDELEAMGGVWQVRGRHGDLLNGRSFHSPIVNCASDIVRMFPEWLAEHKYLGPKGLSAGSRAHLYDEDFAEIVEQARGDIVKEYEPDDAYGHEWSREDLDLYLKLALHRMRAGFRKAERRFGERFCGHETFIAIRDAVKRASRDIQYDGQEFILRYGDGRATLREVADPYGY